MQVTAGKAAITTALRWLPFFLPTLAIAYSTNTATLTTILGIGEVAGLAVLLIGRYLDGGGERRVLAGALVLAATSAVLALVGELWLFAVSFVILTIGLSSYTVAGHTYFSRRVPFERRARTIGLFETSWASALLIGAPLIALLIELFGWRAPFIALATACAVMAVVIARTSDDSEVLADADAPVVRERLSTDAWVVICASSAIAVTGLTTIVIAGTWLDESLGVSTGGIGLVAMAFGAAELLASTSSAAIADRIGPIVATRFALIVTIAGLLMMTQAGASLAIGAIGLLLFFLGFEFSIVTSFSIVSEAMPTARGRALAANNAVGTAARGVGIVVSGIVYESFGISGPVTISISAALVSLTLLTISMHRARRV